MRKGLALAGMAMAALAVMGGASASAAPPPNDAFANAEQLPSGGSVPGTTVEATREPGEPNYERYGQIYGDGSVWYTWTAPRSSRFLVSTCGSAQPTALLVFTGSSLGALTRPYDARDPRDGGGCSTDDNGDSFLFDGKAGTTYRIVVVDRYVGSQGPFQLVVADRPAPVQDAGITTTASRKVVKSGGLVTYTTTLRNDGTVAISKIWLHLVATVPEGPGAEKGAPRLKLRVVRARASQGSCRHHPTYQGYLCAMGALKPGAKAVVKVTMRLRQSIMFWASLDYNPGTGDAVRDDKPGNDERLLKTRIRR